MKQLLIFSSLLMGVSVQADLTTTYGFGAESAGQAGANRHYGRDAFGVTRNVASMSLSDRGFSLGIQGAIDQFQKLDNVVVDNTEIGSTNQVSSVDTDIPDTFNLLIGSVWNLGDTESKPRLGLTMMVPADKLMEPQTKDPYQPQYSMYMTDAQRLTVAAGGSIKLAGRFNVGLGVHYYLVQGATLQGRMLSKSPGDKSSWMNMKMNIKPVVAPILGFIWEVNEAHSLGLAWNGARDARLNMRVDNEVDLGLAAPLAFTSSAALFYDPDVYTLSYAYNADPMKVNLAVDYEKWSAYDGGYIKLDFKTFQGTFQQKPLSTQFKDITVVRLGTSVISGDKTWNFGLGYRPSPAPDQSEKTNYLDSNRIIAGLGCGFETNSILGVWQLPVHIDTHVGYQYLMPKTVTKTVATDVGGPGYEIKGSVVSYGISMTLGI